MNEPISTIARELDQPEVGNGGLLDQIHLPFTDVAILGVRIHAITMTEAVESMERMIESGKPHHIVTVNPEFVMTAQSHIAFRNVLNHASLALPDGIGIVLASRLRGTRLRERVTGIDVVKQFAATAARRGFRMYLLGAAPGIAEIAASNLIAEFPGLQIVGTYAGSPDLDEEDAICARIRAAKPDILLVAYGSPRQDLWISRNLGKLQVPVAIGVGGTFDFLAGIAIRAPRWMQKLGIEWAHRLFREPHRWRRMLALPRYALAVIVSNEERHGVMETTPQ